MSTATVGLSRVTAAALTADRCCANSNTFLMQLYDVGMSSMLVQEAYSLAHLADAIGRPEAAMLRERGDAMSALIGDYLWDEQGQIFTNKFVNNSFYRRISPTSFYALQTSGPNDTQASLMMEQWLHSPEHFCISPNGDFAGNKDTCYWGLPSIQAADPAYPPLGYWRGYVCAPPAACPYSPLAVVTRRRRVHRGPDGAAHLLVAAELRSRAGGAQGQEGAGQADGRAHDVAVERAPPHLRELQPAQVSPAMHQPAA